MLKIVKDNKIIDVVRIPRYIKFLASGHIAITDKASAQGIIGSDTVSIYSFTPVDYKTAGVVSIAEISVEEFNRLQKLLGDKQVISADENAITIAKREAIRRLSNICKSKIVDGFSIKLSDNEIYSFKLTVEDQLNLLMLEGLLNSGEETFIYHATNQPCRLFIKEDMYKIIKAFRKHTLYHTTYFNAAKQYINSLTDIEAISAFTYGQNITHTVENAILKQILRYGGSVE